MEKKVDVSRRFPSPAVAVRMIPCADNNIAVYRHSKVLLLNHILSLKGCPIEANTTLKELRVGHVGGVAVPIAIGINSSGNRS